MALIFLYKLHAAIKRICWLKCLSTKIRISIQKEKSNWNRKNNVFLSDTNSFTEWSETIRQKEKPFFLNMSGPNSQIEPLKNYWLLRCKYCVTLVFLCQRGKLFFFFSFHGKLKIHQNVFDISVLVLKLNSKSIYKCMKYEGQICCFYFLLNEC